MSQQVPGRALELGPNAIDLRGQKFGQLEPLRVVAKRHVGNVWLCLCDCGRFAARTAAALRQAVKDNETPMCQQCRDELSRGLHIEAGNHRLEGLRRLWRRRRKLYSDRALEHYTNQIRSAVALELELDEPECDDPPALPLWGLSLADAIAAVDAPRVHCSPKRPTAELRQYVARPTRVCDGWGSPQGQHFLVETGPGQAACRWCSHTVRFSALQPVQFAKAEITCDEPQAATSSIGDQEPR